MGITDSTVSALGQTYTQHTAPSPSGQTAATPVAPNNDPLIKALTGKDKASGQQDGTPVDPTKQGQTQANETPPMTKDQFFQELDTHDLHQASLNEVKSKMGASSQYFDQWLAQYHQRPEIKPWAASTNRLSNFYNNNILSGNPFSNPFALFGSIDGSNSSGGSYRCTSRSSGGSPGSSGLEAPLSDGSVPGKALEIAYSHLGMNGQQAHDYTNESGAWCAAFVTKAYSEANGGKSPFGGNSHSVIGIIQWANGQAAKGNDLWAHDKSEVKPGDLVVYHEHHIGMVEKIDKDGTIHTIDGNYGDKVTRRTISAGESQPLGFIKMHNYTNNQSSGSTTAPT